MITLSMAIILGIDPGSRLTGFGIVKKSGNRITHIENGTFYLQEHKKYSDRLVVLYQEIQALIAAFKPTSLAIENIFYHKNPKSIQKLGEVRGVAIVSGAISGLPIAEYAPLEVKKAVTGYGNATKDQMQYMVQKLLNLPDLAEENASDALGIAICHAQNDNTISNTIKGFTKKTNQAKELLKKASFYK
jgi:crossover junction endodeoxyribonuclease RuvC